MASLETMTGVAYEGLFAGSEKEVFTKNVTIKSGENIKRGALLSIDSGTGKVIATPAAVEADAENNIDASPAGVAVYVAAEDVNASAADAVGTVFTSGYFNREALIAKTGDTVGGHEEELRSVGIYLSSEK